MNNRLARIYQRLPKDVLPLVVLICLWILFLRNVFGGWHSFALYMDNEYFYSPLLSSMSTSIAHGEWPLRIDSLLGGVPLYNLSQFSAVYPLYFTWLRVFSGPLECIASVHVITLLHLLLMAINSYVLGRVMGISRLSSVVGACLFSFSATMLVYSTWVNIIAPYAWLPLGLAGIVGLLKGGHAFRYSLVTWLACSMQTFASPAQPLIHLLFVGAVLILFATFFRAVIAGEQLRSVLAPVGRLTVATVLTALLVGVVLVPTLLEFKNMIRWIGPFPPVVGNSPIPFKAFLIDQLDRKALAGIFFHENAALLGSPFVGFLVFGLMLVALISKPKSWIVWSLAFVGGYSLLSAFGTHFGFAYVNYRIPFLNKIREPTRFLVLFQLSASMLAGIGIDELRRTVARSGQWPRLWAQFAGLAVAILFASTLALIFHPSATGILGKKPQILGVVGLLSVIALGKRFPFASIGRTCGLALGGACLVLLLVQVPWRAATVGNSLYLTEGGIELDQVFGRIVALDPDRQFRTVFGGNIDKQQAAMLASFKGIRTLNTYVNPLPERQFEDMYYFGPGTPNYFGTLGAKYLVGRDCSLAEIQGFRTFEQVGHYTIYEAEAVLSHHFLMHHVDGTYIDTKDFVSASSRASLRQGLLYVPKGVNLDLSSQSPWGTDLVRELERKNTSLRYLVQSNGPAILVVNEYFDPAWRVAVDGVHRSALQVNANQIGVSVGTGGHLVEFKYRPENFLVGLALSLSGLIAGLVYFLAWYIRRQRGQSERAIAAHC